MPRKDNVSVRWPLTHCDIRESFISELLRRFGVSGRKRSYQTLLVAARSSRRPFSLYSSLLAPQQPDLTLAQPTCLVDERNQFALAFPVRRQRIRHSGEYEPGMKSGRPVSRPPRQRHSEVRAFMVRPGSGWASKSNFSKNNNTISNIKQSHKWSFTTAYAGISGSAFHFPERPLRETEFFPIECPPHQILRGAPLTVFPAISAERCSRVRESFSRPDWRLPAASIGPQNHRK